MAKDNVTGFIGNDSVELNNAATETTLAAILAQDKIANKTLLELAKAAKIDTKKIEAAMAKQGDAGHEANAGLSKVGKSSNMLGGFLADMTASVGATIGNLSKFGDQLFDGTAKASDFVNSFKDLPFLIGQFAGLVAKSLKILEDNLEVNRSLSRAGVSLAGDLMNVRTSAFQMYLSMDEMVDMFNKSSDVLARFNGGGKSFGDNLKQINTLMVAGGIGDRLLNMGRSFSELAAMAGQYVRVSNNGIDSSKKLLDEQTRIAKSAANYGEQLDLMSRLTGDNIDSIQKKMEEEATEASWQFWLASQAPQVRDNLTVGLMKAMEAGGKPAADYFKAKAMNFAGAFSEGGIAMQTTMPRMAEQFDRMVDAAKRGVKSEDYSRISTDAYARAIVRGGDDLKNFMVQIQAGGLGLGGFYNSLKPTIEQLNKLRASGAITEEDMLKQVKAAIESQKNSERQNASMVALDKQFKNLSFEIMTALAPVITMLADVGIDLAKSFGEFIEDHLPEIKSAMKTVADYLQNLFTEEGRQKIWNDIKTLFKYLAIEIKGMLADAIPFGRSLAYSETDQAKDQKRVQAEADVADAKAKEALLIEKTNKQQQLVNDLNDKEFDARLPSVQDKIKTLKDNKELTEQQKKDLAKYQAEEKDLKNRTLAIAGQNVDKATERLADLKGLQQDAKNKIRESSFVLARGLRDDWDSGSKQTAGPGEINWESALSNGFASGTLGNGKLIRDFGKESLAKLHGKEAVLTEAQLTNMAKGIYDAGANSSGGNVTLGGLESLNETVIMLNKNAEKTAKLIDTLVDVQKKAYNKMPGNKLV
jgi:hypothetical protein